MTLGAGAKLGTYEIVGPLGVGGMGEVYRARDSKLKREVAIKVLPDEFSRDPDRISRFQREAEALAALNHSNIAAIYDVQQVGGSRFLVLELVDGETLAERMHRGALPIEEALQVARQICEALEAAHEKGIIHRDLKPANIKVTPGGKVKLLDFGLARLFETEVRDADLSNSPTLIGRTAGGVILGTAAYMSPEQARGQKAGKQSDIWAFGCVLYEMLTGRQAFRGDTITDILSGVLRIDPDWKALPALIPNNIDVLLRRCLQKEAHRRLRDIGDAKIEIEEPTARDAAGVKAPRGSNRMAWTLVVVMAVAFVLATVAASALYFRPAGQRQEMRLQVITPPTDDLMSLAISPDGQRIVFVGSTEGKTQLWIRALESDSAQPLPGTEGASYPFWSPDSRSLGFFAEGKLKRIDIGGGPARVLADASLGRGGAWNPDGVIIFAPSSLSPLYSISAAAGGQPVPVTTLDPPRHTGHRFPQFLPDDRHFIFNSFGNPEGRGVYLGSLDSPQVRQLFDANTNALYVPAGYLLFMREETLLAQRFDMATFQLAGEPIVVAEKVSSDSARQVAAFSSAADLLAYRAGTASSARQLEWFDRSGKSIGVVGAADPNGPFNPSIASDGQRVALDRQVSANRDVWLLETTRGVATRFTVDAVSDRSPVWSPEGSRIVFGSTRSTGVADLYERPSSGAGAEQLLLASPLNKLPLDWSQDGRFILYRHIDPNGGYDLWVLPLFGDRKPFPLANTPFEERDGQFSPDGRWVAYRSNESGRFEVYVRPFPGPGGKSQVSTNGGTQPRWRGDGRELFYIAPDSTLMDVSVAVSPDGKVIKAGTPTALFPTRIAGGPSPGTNNQQYAVSPDGQRFLINVAPDEASTPITVVLNWNPESKP